MAKNEATLEARLDSILSSVFPTFRDVNVEHQKSFSIKFGHHNVMVDFNESTSYPSKAVCDILLTIEKINVILLELKKEEQKLTLDDVSQGLSYARLLHPMPPLTLISNGKDNQFYNTYSKEKIDITNIDLAFIQAIIDNSFQLATNDFKEAINLLLNKEPELFSQVINQISENRFERFFGAIDDFRKPICCDFRIERNVISEIHSYFAQGEPLVGVIGSAFSGKTNLLYDFFQKTKSAQNFLLYLDCSDYNYSILQQLANVFSRSSKISISKDKIREWLNNSLINLPESKFFLLLDNFNDEIPEVIKEEIIELIDMFDGVNQHTLYTIDEFNFKKIAYLANKPYKTLIGDKSKIVNLDELDDDEYSATNKLMLNDFQVEIERGGHYTPEYREPRILRYLVSYFTSDIESNQYTKIIAVPDYELLNKISGNKTYSDSHDLYYKMALCFFSETEFSLRKADAYFNIMACGSGAISKDFFKKKFPDDFDRLIKSSVVVLRVLPNGLTVIYPKIRELFAKHSIPLVTEKILSESRAGKTIEEICKIFIDLVTPIPYCDIVATGVLLQIGESNEISLFMFVLELMKFPPHMSKIRKGTKILMYSDEDGHIPISFDDDGCENEFVSDFLPYVILSQLARYPLGLFDDENNSIYSFHLELLYEVGSNTHFLRRADVRSSKNMKHFKSVELKGVGSFVVESEGIIEPIVQSLQKCFFEIPDEIEHLYNRAFDENNLILLYRINLAIGGMRNHIDLQLASRAMNFVIKFNKFCKIYFEHFFLKEIQDPQIKDEFRTWFFEQYAKIGLY